jgi:type III secretion protein V
MLIVPLPPLALDVLLAANLAAASLILVVALLSPNAIAVSSFPTVLLLTTLFRLGLNVSTTRWILLKGDAGEVVEAFGRFVVRGDLVVGLVIFAVITLVQFLVIAKGAERVAEVAARFTLDALPGKQMSIDAALRAGALTEAEAQAKREELGRESQLFGAMDGAMKFIKGDAIAGLVITAINLIAGFAIGVARLGLSAGAAAESYSILTIGDGLVSQLPALLITLAAGVLTTRVSPKERGQNLGDTLKLELFADPKVLAIGGGLCGALALIPGLPGLPFALIAAGLLGMARARQSAVRRGLAESKESSAGKRDAFKKALEEKVKQAKAQRSLADQMAPSVLPIAVDLEPSLAAALGLRAGGEQECELVSTMLPELRDHLYLSSGVRFPGIRVRIQPAITTPNTFVVRLREVAVLEETFPADRLLVLERPARLLRLGIRAEATPNPLTPGADASLIAAKDRPLLAAAGVQAWTASGVIVLHLADILQRHARDFVGLQEVSELVERLEKAFPALVKEVVPKLVSLPQLVDVLRRLVEERISIRDLKAILEALADHAGYENDPVVLTELVRAALSLQIASSFAGLRQKLHVVLLDPVIEDTVRSAVHPARGGARLALEPELWRSIIEATARTLRPVMQAGVRPVILTSAEVRRFVRCVLERELPEVAVLSYEELPPDLTIEPLGRVVVREALAA